MIFLHYYDNIIILLKNVNYYNNLNFFLAIIIQETKEITNNTNNFHH